MIVEVVELEENRGKGGFKAGLESVKQCRSFLDAVYWG